MNRTAFFCIVFVSSLFLGCAVDSETVDGNNESPRLEEGVLEGSSIPEGVDSLLQFFYKENSVDVQLLYPQGAPKGTILLLQGWNFPITDWCDSTSICRTALNKGYVIVCPDMGKSIYSESIYEETRRDWLKYPTRNWLINEMIPALQNTKSLFLEENENFVVGLSTGARGALLTAMDLPEVFTAAACLSGDYDQSAFPSDNLYKGFFGSKKDFLPRWDGKENPITRINQLQVPLYIGHGVEDKIVPIKHFEILSSSLHNIDVPYKLNRAEGYDHNYRYWESEVGSIFQFFDFIVNKMDNDSL